MHSIFVSLTSSWDQIILTTPLALACLVSIISSFLVGYNTSVMNAPAAVVFPDHSTAVWSWAVAAFAIGGPGGAIAGGFMANRRGRKGAMMVNMWIFLVGGLIMAVAPSVGWLIPGRFITGFASGLASVLVPVYLGEMAPPTLRGTLGTWTQFAIVIGILFSDLLAFPLATPRYWRCLFAVTPCLALLQLLLSPFLLESPRWLLGRDENSVEARVVIKKMRGFRNEEEITAEAQNYIFASQKHKTKFTSAHSGGAMLDLLKSREVRVLVVSSVTLQMAQQLCGINAVFYYSTTFFEGVISNPLLGTTLVGAVNVLATYAALLLMDTSARRDLILWSAGGMLVSTVLLTVILLGYLGLKWVAILAVMSYVAFFEIGLGPIPWLIVAEMFDAKYVATAMSLSCIVNWICNFLVGLLFPYMNESLGAWCFMPFAIVLLATLVFTYTYLPETHGRTVEEIHRLVGGDAVEVTQKLRQIIHAVEDINLGDGNPDDLDENHVPFQDDSSHGSRDNYQEYHDHA
jgi:SP family facilitated glucose transporter-like MFS transporter 3